MPTEQEFKEREAYWEGYRLGRKDGECDGRRSEKQNFRGFIWRLNGAMAVVLIVVLATYWWTTCK